jgi:hypothetical protein
VKTFLNSHDYINKIIHINYIDQTIGVFPVKTQMKLKRFHAESNLSRFTFHKAEIFGVIFMIEQSITGNSAIALLPTAKRGLTEPS